MAWQKGSSFALSWYAGSDLDLDEIDCPTGLLVEWAHA